MASLYNRFLDFIGIEESDEPEEEYDRGYYRDEPREKEREREREPERDGGNVVSFSGRGGASPRRVPHERGGASNGGNLPISGGMKMIVYHPVSYEDTQIIIDNLKNRKPVIVNMEDLEVECAQRILDFLSGAIYALSGTMCKISRGIFVVAPNNYDVVGNDDYQDD